jgi:hypothetical protein
MPAIRVTIGDMPQLLRSFVDGILEGDPKFELTPGARGSPLAESGTPDFDVLVVSEVAMQRTWPGARALNANGALGIVAIAPDGHDAAVMRLDSHRTRLDDSPRQSLSNAILDAAGVAPDPGG